MRDWLKASRKTAGYTQEQLAHEVGVTLSAVQQWEAGKTFPGRPTWKEIARVLKDDSIPVRFAAEHNARLAKKRSMAVA